MLVEVVVVVAVVATVVVVVVVVLIDSVSIGGVVLVERLSSQVQVGRSVVLVKVESETLEQHFSVRTHTRIRAAILKRLLLPVTSLKVTSLF